MATKTLIKPKKNAPRIPKKRGAASPRPATRLVSTTEKEMLAQKQVAAVPAESSTVFDPHLILTRLVGGKSTQEYQSGESVFAQGDKADAVFYIQSGNATSSTRARSDCYCGWRTLAKSPNLFR